MNINWYPGHMAKTRRLISEDLKLVDAVVEVLDARIPVSSKNPDIDELCKNKPKIVLLNKSDMADDAITDRWITYYKEQGILALKVNCETGEGLKRISSDLKELLKEKLARNREKGVFKPIRIMVVGIPNSGKSSFINRVANNKRLKTEDRPGVTVHKQWVKVSNEIELMDTPGILWPKFEDPNVGIRLAYTGAVKDDVIDLESLACHLMQMLWQQYPQVLKDRYKIDCAPDAEGWELLEAAGRKRGFLVSGGEVNTERMAKVLLDEYRSCKLGRFTLETPEMLEKEHGEN